MWREGIVLHAYRLARASKGAPGVDGQSFAMIEADGLEEWLTGLREDLRAKTYRPRVLGLDPRMRRVMIPKPGGGERAPELVEGRHPDHPGPGGADRRQPPGLTRGLIFEADLDPNAYGYRPRRSATDAIERVGDLLRSAHTDVVDGPGLHP